MSAVRVSIHADAVFLVAIERPEAKNAFDAELIDLFVESLGEVAALSPRAVVITGTGDVFSAGYDIHDIDPSASEGAPLPDVLFERVIRAVEEMPCPVVAALNGHAFGGGLDLALACDLRLAVKTAKLAMTPCRLGLVYSPSGISRFMSKLGGTLTRRLFFTARPMTAAEAQALGLIEVVPKPLELLPAALELAGKIARNAPLAVRGTRETILALERSAALSLSGETRAVIEEHRQRAFRSHDLKEGLAAFAEKRKPHFSGS
jgi:enoyl-CoA hydratase/carnithine racemase